MSRGAGGSVSSTATVAYKPCEEWWLLLSQYFSCPICRGAFIGFELIPHLNDDHHWTREKVADFIDRHEHPTGQRNSQDVIYLQPL